MSDATALLRAIQDGDRSRFNDLYQLLYGELLRIARSQRGRWQGDYTLNATAIVHEAYLKLVDVDEPHWNSRAHFLATAAKAMRHILLDYASKRNAVKRGGDIPRRSLERLLESGDQGLGAYSEDERAADLMALDQTLRRLAQAYPRAAEVVECRVFGGMQVNDIAAALDVSDRTVKRDWALAQAWLRRDLNRQPS